jgi:hypothetical protein
VSESEIDHTRSAMAALFACTVRAMEKSGTISGDDWLAELMASYNSLGEGGSHNLPTMETLNWAIQAYRLIRDR